MKSKDFLEEKIKAHKEFSIHSLINQDKLTKEEAKKVVDLAKSEPRLSKYFFLLCSHCKAKCSEGMFREDLVGKEHKCFVCEKKFTAYDKNFQLVFDPRSLKERFKD